MRFFVWRAVNYAHAGKKRPELKTQHVFPDQTAAEDSGSAKETLQGKVKTVVRRTNALENVACFDAAVQVSAVSAVYRRDNLGVSCSFLEYKFNAQLLSNCVCSNSEACKYAAMWER